ncbi:hypothetical protein CHU95_18545 [Niveispirillum lacus]|uniref:Uncharacterized protein n=1 Tax=Niveispirillum lacus TaxID=1981099 RepID=A0A255YVT5_9PROT|nr:hypothetical protein [Niveispirillum lacus]OYQ32755.1 hypothetical protein CHU95_18545 [Niveispirillum lacus]
MTDISTEHLRLLAVKIAKSYAQGNPVAPEQLTVLIQQAYQGLHRCINQPPAAPAAVKKRRRGRPRLS